MKKNLFGISRKRWSQIIDGVEIPTLSRFDWNNV